MSREKQIEEMACDMCTVILNCNEPCDPIPSCHAYQHAKRAFEKGYRKQSEGEWVRYPHGSGIYCSLCKHKRRYRDINDAYCPNCGAKMKGGAE